jgi:hypothetical protein
MVQVGQPLFQSRAGGGLGWTVVRTGGNKTCTKGDAQTNKDPVSQEMIFPGGT